MLFDPVAYEKVYPRKSEPEMKPAPEVKEEPAGDMLEAAGTDPSDNAEEGGADGD